MIRFIRLLTQTILPILFISLLSVQVLSQPLPIQFDQAQNGKAPGFPITWTNGILNATHTTYYEGVSTPQRLFLWNLDQTNDGTANHHTVKIRHLAEASGKHAYDFITSWSQAVAEAQNIGGSVNEFGVAGVNLYNAQLDDAPSEFTGGNAAFFNHAAFNSGNPNYASDTYMPATFGDPTGTVPSVDAVLSCWINGSSPYNYGNPFFEIAGNAPISGFTVTAEPGYDGGNYKVYTISWSSTSDRVLLLFAGHPAIGQTTASPICGYGIGQGAGSVNGGDYHIKLDYRDGSIGERDNQVMSSTFQIPPTCGLTGPNVVCPETPSIVFQYQGTNAANASLVFTFTSNTANASFANGSVLNTLNATANSSGAYTLTVYPASASGFTAGGDFQVHVQATTSGGSCGQDASLTHIELVQVAAIATPSTFAITSASHNSVLNAYATIDDGAPTSLNNNNSDFNFQWSVAAPYTLVGTSVQLAVAPNTVVGTLTGANTSQATFTAAPEAGGITFTFNVTATQVASPNCSGNASTTVTVTPGSACVTPTGDNPVCQGTTHQYCSSQTIGADETWTWKITAGDATLVGADANGEVTNVTCVNVTAGTTNFTLRLRKTYANTDLSPSDCPITVTVNPTPSCTITGDDPVCEMTTYTYTSTIDPSGGTVTHSWSITGNGTINGSTTGPSVSVTSGSINNGTSFTLRDDITRNGCSNYCTKTVTVQDCGSGCTIGFWKTHPEVWNGSYALPPKSKEKTDIQGLVFWTGTTFNGYMGFIISGMTTSSTMLNVLSLAGGDCQTVARQGVGSLLNAIAFSDYPYPAGTSNYTELKTLITQVLQNGSYTTNGVTYNCTSLAVALNSSNNHEVFDVNGVSICSGLPGTQTNFPVTLTRIDRQQLTSDNLSVRAYPNPFNRSINFNISSAAQGKATLEIFDMLGRRLALVYEGNLESGTAKTITYKVPNAQRVSMIYKLTVGSQTIYGKLLPNKE